MHLIGYRMATYAGLLALVLMGLVEVARADSAAGWAALREPGAIAVMRHALAPGTGDPRHFQVDDCATQRNLDDRGRAQARAIGEAFRANGIETDRVLTSQWCRCRETAELLGIGPVEDLPALNSFFQDRSTARAQTEETVRFLQQVPRDQRVVLVTHQVNMTALSGAYPSSGEVFVLQLGDEGSVSLTGRIMIDP